MTEAACTLEQSTWLNVSVWKAFKRLQRVDADKIFIVDAPIVGTLPHFYNADKRYNYMVDGLEPDEDKHNIFLDVEPRTGSPLNGGKRLQFNMFLKKIDRISECLL